MKKYLITLIFLALSVNANSSEKKHNHSQHDVSHGSSQEKVKHSAHEHGVAEMNVARFGKEVQIELFTPSFNLLGFEHKPNTEDQKTTLSRVEKVLRAPATLFSFEGATCAVEHVSIKSPFEQADHDGEHKHDHENEHKEKQKTSHGHDHKQHGNKADNDESSHSEYMLTYHFECEDSKESLKMSANGLFSNFSNFSTIRTQWLSDSEQGSVKLTSKNSQLSIK